jgi:heterodisulfide reductase subunit A
VDQPIAIQHLKRFALDWARKNKVEVRSPQIEKRPGKVAIIGSGPAGLTCAHDLAVKGFQVTVFERSSTLGGMLALGIPAYRLPRHLLKEEIDYMKRLGVDFKTNRTFSGKLGLSQLKQQGYKAIFLAIGAHGVVKLDIPGENLAEVYSGVEYLRRVNSGIKTPLGKKVGVIGGGNTAIDAARTALRMGAERVAILYRRTRAEMPAAAHEVNDAEAEGVAIHYLIAPTQISRPSDNGLARF